MFLKHIVFFSLSLSAIPTMAISLFDTMPSVGASPTGYVKMIAIDDERDLAYIKLGYTDGNTQREEIFQICHGNELDKQDFYKSEIVAGLRSAFERNEKIALKVSSIFNRCITGSTRISSL